MALCASVETTMDTWNQEMHCRYPKCTMQYSYGFTSADASLPVAICARNKQLCCFSFIVLTGNTVLLFEVE